MNAAYVYLQLYRLFDNITPLKADCGKLCKKACCKGDDCGMYLFPGEKRVFDIINAQWAELEKSDFCYAYEGKKRNVPILFCNGTCDRYQRPLACRIFPLTPYLKDGKLSIIIDPRAKSVCPLARAVKKEELEPEFVKNVEKTFRILLSNKEFYAFTEAYSAYLDDFLRFYSE